MSERAKVIDVELLRHFVAAMGDLRKETSLCSAGSFNSESRWRFPFPQRKSQTVRLTKGHPVSVSKAAKSPSENHKESWAGPACVQPSLQKAIRSIRRRSIDPYSPRRQRRSTWPTRCSARSPRGDRRGRKVGWPRRCARAFGPILLNRFTHRQPLHVAEIQFRVSVLHNRRAGNGLRQPRKKRFIQSIKSR